MTTTSIPFAWLFWGNEHWRSYRATNEIEIYCDLLDNLQDRIDSLEIRGKEEEVTLCNVQAVISSYAFEIAMKSLWALDHPADSVPYKQDLLFFFDGLIGETVESLKRLPVTREGIEKWPKPFVKNRYSMENADREFTVYPSRMLRPLIELIGEKVEESREALLKPPRA